MRKASFENVPDFFVAAAVFGAVSVALAFGFKFVKGHVLQVLKD